MRVLLIRPPYRAKKIAPNFPIGLACLAAALEGNGHEPSILDLPLAPAPIESLRRALGQEDYPLIGIGALTAQFAGVREVIPHIRSHSPGSRIVLGGPHASGCPEEAIEQTGADFAIRGEGEKSLVELASALEWGAELRTVPALVYRNDVGFIRNPLREPLPPMDDLPLPAYHLLDLEPYIQMLLSECVRPGSRPLQILTSRGCPYRCTYCHNLFGKRFRGRSPQSVLSEILLLNSKYGVNEFLVHDDIFNFEMDRAREIFRLVLKSELKIGFSFPNGLRAEFMDEDLMGLMAAAGVHTVGVGIECASRRLQESTRKHLCIPDVDRFLRIAKHCHMQTQGFFMIGFPDENAEEIHQTIRYARRTKELDTAFFSFPTPYPGTELARQLAERGEPVELGSENSDTYTPHFRVGGLGYRKLVWLRMKAYLYFYLTPRRLWAIFRDLGNPQFAALYLNPLRRMVQMLTWKPRGVTRP
ncbi:MAG: B12-binding domain-containing radical SAM protein [Acidobacteriia bacterium]|nr:B12-binding domain-containing radical SAM protein [Terriglobia bacterium]